MKRMLLILVALLIGVLNQDMLAADKAVNFPTITRELQDAIRCSEVFVGGEESTLNENEEIVITFENQVSKKFRVNMETVQEQPSWKKPVFTNTSATSDKLIPDDNLSLSAFHGRKTFKGTAIRDGLLIFFEAWAPENDATVPWSVKVTWGNGATFGSPGVTLDCGHRGIVLPDEKINSGIEVLAFQIIDGYATLTAPLDREYSFTIEESTDLLIWKSVPGFARSTTVVAREQSGQLIKIGNIRPYGSFIGPVKVTGPRLYYRLRLR